MKRAILFLLFALAIQLQAATYYVATNGVNTNPGTLVSPWRTVQYAVDSISAGDTIKIGQGDYDELVDTRTGPTGDAANKVTIDGQGVARIFRFYHTKPHWNFYNITVKMLGTDPGTDSLFEMALGSHFTTISNCFFDGTGTIYSPALDMTIGSGIFNTNAASFCTVVSNAFTGTKGQTVWYIAGSSNLFRGNISTNHIKVDFIRLWGRYNVIADNVFSNNMPTPAGESIGYHADFIQTYGVNGQGSIGHIIERNLIVDSESQICQLVEGTADSPELIGAGVFGSWHWRNNVFARVALGCSQSIPTNHWYNNVFYQVGGTPVGSGNPDRGSTHGCKVYNNVFLECVDPLRNNVGWYDVDTNFFDTAFDHNYVAGKGYGAKREECPIGIPFRWCEPNGINGGDPRFVNEYLLDFRLRPDSPLIGAGTNLTSYFTNDFWGVERTNSGAWNIGITAGAYDGTLPNVYYVATTGDDGNAGTYAAPKRNIQTVMNLASAGDSIRVFVGDYAEHLDTVAPGSNGAPISIVGWPVHSIAMPSVRQFNVDQPYTTIQWIQVKGAQNGLDAHFRLTSGANYSVISSNLIGPGVYVRGTNITIDSTARTLTLSSGTWTNYGFEVGGEVFLGACSLAPYYYANHDRTFTVDDLSGATMTLSGTWDTETNTTPWITVFTGTTHDGILGIDMPSPGPTNVYVLGNTISNTAGPAISLSGSGHVVAYNRIEKLQGASGLRPRGHDCLVYSNLFLNTERFLFFSPADASDVNHADGPDWYDFVAGYIHTAGLAVTNNYIFKNWFQDIDQPICQLAYLNGGWGMYLRSNVFVGVVKSGSLSLNAGQFDNNTVYRSAYGPGEFRALASGGNSLEPSTNVAVRWNAFVDLGDHSSPSREYGYSITVYNINDGSELFLNDYNFLANAETLAWQGDNQFVDPNGISGTDPLFVNESDPLGPDGLPFTEDDGLRPLPNSPLVTLNAGALPAMPAASTTQPYSHFTLTSISTGYPQWHDGAPDEYNAPWFTLAPFQRTNWPRPWRTPESLGQAPVTAGFSAANSISGTTSQTNWDGIISFQWTIAWAEGQTNIITTNSPYLSHTFEDGGTYYVGLRVVNSSGYSDDFERPYRINYIPSPPPPQPEPEPGQGGGRVRSNKSSIRGKIR